MFEDLGLDGWTPVGASLVAGLVIGVLFGVLAQRSRFCLRRGLVGQGAERSSALGVWLLALGVAVLLMQAAALFEWVSFADHRFVASSLPAGAIVVGGLLFGFGMVLTRGCASRLTVLAGQGNLRAWISILIFAVVAHATLKGVLAPARTWISSFSVETGGWSLASLPGGGMAVAVVLALVLLAVAVRSGARWSDLVMAALIGVIAAVGWVVTGYVLFDEFDPITFESLAFTSSASETLFWSVAGTAFAPAFGVGIFGGTLLGSFLAASASGEFRVEGFDGETPVGRYIAGASLMGVGGVLAGGCTIGAGLSGIGTLGVAPVLALLSIVAGARIADATLDRAGHGRMVPAE